MLNQTYTLNLIPNQSAPVTIPVSQFDSGSRTLEFKFIAGSEAFTLTQDMSSIINGVKPDKYVFVYDATVDASSNTVSIDIVEQMTAVAGRVICEIVIFDEQDNRLGSANFTLLVEPSPLSGGTVSDSDIPVIEEAVESAREIIALAPIVEEQAEHAAESAAEAASSASSASEDADSASADADRAGTSALNAASSATSATQASSAAATSASQAVGSASAASTAAAQARQYRDEASAIVGPSLYSLMIDSQGYIALRCTEGDE